MSEPVGPTLGIQATRLRSDADPIAPDPGLREPALDSLAIDLQRERLLAGMFGVQAEAPQLGHYALIEEIGRGGMSVVYEAYDRKLDRRVAIKLLNKRLQGQAARRLNREAQGLAKLSHPNVVQIHEIGEHEGGQFLVMEFVVGETLRAWATAVDEHGELVHSVETRLEALVQAGRGLAAAHAANIIHRDFKPDNVIVGEDGRVRVLDFGLARGLAPTENKAPLDSAELLTTTKDSGAAVAVSPTAATVPAKLERKAPARGSLTRTGTVMGTPGYMAPEQLAAQPCGPLADQFAFCVVAYEVLYGHRPFAGNSLAELAAAIQAGEIASIDDGIKVPARVHAAILRGLEPESTQRWQDTRALLDELEHALRPKHRRRLGWAAGTVLGGSLAAAGSWALTEPPPEMCVLDESELGGVWDEARRAALRSAYATRVLVAERSFEVIDETMTNWGAKWFEGKRRSCQSTHVRGTQSEAMLDLRDACFERQRREAAVIGDLLTHPDGSNLDHAFELVGQLPEVAVCEDPRLGETTHPMPEASRDAIQDASAQLTRVRSFAVTSRFDEAEALLEELESTAEHLGYLPLSLEVELADAELSINRHRIIEAEPRVQAVIQKAEVAGLDELSATARTHLASSVVGWWRRAEDQLAILREAETAVMRVGRPSDARKLALALARAKLLAVKGDFEGALEGSRAIAEQARERGDLGLALKAMETTARMLQERGAFDEAEKTHLERRALFEQRWGPSASLDSDIELHLGLSDLERGRFDEAETHLARARTLLEPLFEPGTERVSLLEIAEAKLALMRGDLESARLGFERVAERSVNDIHQAEAWEALGVIRFYQGDMPGSLDAYRRAQAKYLLRFEADHPTLGLLSSNMGESLAASGDHQGALVAIAEALEILGRHLPPTHPDLALPYKARAQSRVALGQWAGAQLDLEHALAIHEANPGEPIERADVEFTLARVLLNGGDRTRAIEFAKVAHRRLLEFGHDTLASPLAKWLDENGCRDHETCSSKPKRPLRR